jgi:hypothetical protein
MKSNYHIITRTTINYLKLNWITLTEFEQSWSASVVWSLACSSRVWYIVGSSPGRVKPDYKIRILCLSVKHWLIQNLNNMSNCSNMSTHRLFYQWSSTIKIQPSTSTKRQKMPKYACENATSFWALLANVIPWPLYSIHKLDCLTLSMFYVKMSIYIHSYKCTYVWMCSGV